MPKLLESVMNPLQTNQSRSYVFFFGIPSYIQDHSLYHIMSLINMSF